jgi:ATP-dependent helicase HrpB
VLASLRRTPNLVIEAPPGAGKTTRVPPALLELGEVLVLEPRRLAARMAARRVSFEMGEPLGKTVGYQVRFEDVGGPETRLRFLTEGVLTRRMLSDAKLRNTAVVVLDEFHERHLDGDLALALLLRLQRTSRPDLRIVVMSATLNAGAVAAHLNAPVLRSEGRLFDLDISYTPHSPTPLEEQVSSALERLGATTGDVLVFLPGAAEIRRASRACESLAARTNLLLLPLHGDLSPEEQDRAVAPANRRKVILSTNVAESSVTIDGVTAVIDSGLARIASDSPWTGLPALTVQRISRASATQRAGRAGRTAPGRVIRLYTAEDFGRRPEQDAPEVLRREMSQTLLDLRAMDVADPAALPWMDAPPQTAIESACDLLRRLGAVDDRGALTAIGRRMARLPLHPRLARLLVESVDRKAGQDGCRIAAVLSAGERLREGAHPSSRSDVLALMDAEWSPRTKQHWQQIRRMAPSGPGGNRDDAPLLLSILSAFPDRVARQTQNGQLLMAGGGSALLAKSSIVKDRFLVAVDVEDRSDQAAPIVRLASAIEPEWLIDLYPDRVRDRDQVEWNRTAERVESSSALLFDNIVIEESRSGSVASDAAAELLSQKALEAGVERFADPDELVEFLARAEFAAQQGDSPPVTEETVQNALRDLCTGIRSFGELKSSAADGGLIRAISAQLPGRAHSRIEELAPSRIRLPGGRNARVRYASGQAPWVASRLQDFFGMKETPRIAGGKVPLVVHLLAPNQRPVQTTTDLAGFWERLYPEIRRQLMRRYPKHSWPEKP